MKKLSWVVFQAVLVVGFASASTVFADVADTTGPVVGSINISSTRASFAQVYQASYYDSSGVTGCRFFLNGSDSGYMFLSGSTMQGTASITLPLYMTGTYTAQMRCTDTNGNSGVGPSTSLMVNASQNVLDTVSPGEPANLSLVSSHSAGTFAWNAAYDAVGVTNYEIQVDGGMFLGIGDVRNYTTMSLSNGMHSFAVRALDAAGNASGKSSLTFNIANVHTTDPSNSPFLLSQFTADAGLVMVGTRVSLASSLGINSCELSASAADALTQRTLGTVSGTTQSTIANFIGCGTQTSFFMGAGERAGIVNSYRAAFGHLPMTVADWNDVLKIGNGRFPAAMSTTAETVARANFRLVFLRNANPSITSDNNAVTVMAYGLRPIPRNMNAEAVAIVTFQKIFKIEPTSARDWDIVRAIAYSGATR